nr:MAG TPA: hypothetical protein [Caudoviricetes sp.]
MHPAPIRFMELRIQSNPKGFSCSALFATHNGLKHIL